MERKLFWGQYLIWVILLLEQLHGCKSCIEKERKALLELKKYMISRSWESYLEDVVPTWTNDTKSDCCQWEGIKCNRTSRRVIELSVGTMYFKEISPLNLSLLHPFEEIRSLNLSRDGYNNFNGFFDDVEGYKSLRTLRNLEILDLSSNGFNNSIFPFLNAATSLTSLFLRSNIMEGPFPYEELKDLKNLELLDLSVNDFHGSIPELKNLTNLQLLDLSGNFFSGSVSELKYLTNLELLDLSLNNFKGSVSVLSNLKKLKAVDLSWNGFSNSMELQDLKNLTNLEVLGIAYNHLDGPIPIQVVCKMKNLRELNLGGNHFVGQLPLCLGSLHKLQVLDISSNQFSGNLPSSFSSLESLEYLSLLDNNFTGLFPLNPLTNLTKLKVFKLSSTSNMIQVETESTWQPEFQLSVAVLRSCGLDKIPSFLGYQKNLRLVDLSSNRLSGDTPTWLLANNPELEGLKLQSNSFTIIQMPTMMHSLKVLDFSANDISGFFPDNIGRALPNLVFMNGSNNEFQGHFPSSIGEMKNISLLDLSYNSFSGKLPRNFLKSCFSLKYLKLSHNKFSGQFLPRGTSFTSMEVMRMDNNLFSGMIEVGLNSSTMLSLLDMSNNRLTGAIPSWISKLSHMQFLLLSNNLLEGTIPPSLRLIPYHSILDLSGNLYSGALPSHFHSVINLFLNNNNFTGLIPDTVLESVHILDLRNNKLSGSIPQFVNTQDIRILLLKGNNLTGSIPRQLCDLTNIRLLDISDNKLNGFIPSCLNNISFGREEYMGHYIMATRALENLELEFYKSRTVVEKLEVLFSAIEETEIKFATKKRYDSYTGRSTISEGILDYMYGIDLSNNELSGAIPAELGDLSKLRALNLSHNFLPGLIPSSFSNLKNIESLDLSNNMLHGSIPHQLTSLTSLAVFDVSYNNLSGIIPQGNQFDTFNESSYFGNPLLCGPPTNISCETKKSTEEAENEGQKEDDEAHIDMFVFYFSTASTYVVTLIGILVLMCFDSPWRRAWLRIVDTCIASAKSMFS